MSERPESFVFDASNYPGFEKAMALRKRLTTPSDSLLIKGVGTIFIFAAAIIWFVLSGEAEAEPLALLVIVLAAVIIMAAVVSMHLAKSDDPRIPVQVTSAGNVVIGNKRWSLDSIGSIVAFGHSGAVGIRDRSGRTLALPYRAQFGSFDDFMIVVRRFRPDLEASRETTNVKVRVPRDRS